MTSVRQNDDMAYRGDAVLASDEDDVVDDAPQATLKLLGDFPEPLTEPQRRAVQRYVTQKLREYEVVRHQVAIVERGYLALLRLVKRLRREQAELQRSLNDGDEKSDTSASAAVSPSSRPLSEAKSSVAPEGSPTLIRRPTSIAVTSVSSNSTTKEPAVPPKRRPGGLLLRSSVFNGFQKALQAAQTEQRDEKAEQLARARERIARESRLRLVSEDLASQEALLEPLQRKYTRAVSLGTEAADRCAPLLTLLDDMWRLEAHYPSRFAMLAKGNLEPLLYDAVHGDGDGDRAEEDRTGAAGGTANHSADDGSSSAVVMFSVPFTPAQYTAEVEDLIRAQVEEVIDEYLGYRTRMDPVLYQLEQAQQLAKARKVDQLMDIIGISGTEAGAEVRPLGEAPALPGTSLVTATTSMRAALHISSEEDDDEDAVVAGAPGEEAIDADRHDREQIRTALTALDDFEDN